jgi:hypothetical protein
MRVQRVKSVTIRGIGYDAPSGLLWIEYRGLPGGHLYREVPRHVFDDIMQAAPIDRYANFVLRDYPCDYRAHFPETTAPHSC